jgi:hypothetical protein
VRLAAALDGCCIRPVPGRLEDVSDKEMPEQERAWLADLGSGQPEDAGNQQWRGRPWCLRWVIGGWGRRSGGAQPALTSSQIRV